MFILISGVVPQKPRQNEGYEKYNNLHNAIYHIPIEHMQPGN